ncbi:ribonuclease H-like domain-containing protein [Tanacetum coccineum]
MGCYCQWRSRRRICKTFAPPAPKTAKQLAAKRNQERVTSILLLAIPDEYLLKFHNVAVAKSLWEAIKSSLDKAYDRFQKLISQLEVHGAPISKEDINQKFLRSLPSSWNQIALIMRNKPDIDEIDIDDLYNNLRVYEDELKRSSGSNSASQNLAFLSSENTGSTNEVSTASGDFGVSTAGGINQVPSTPCAHDIAYSFLAQPTTSPQLENEDFQQMDGDDLEELDLRWQVAMLTVRALVAQDGLGGYDWSNDFEVEPFNYALMAISSSSSSSSFESEVQQCSKCLKSFKCLQKNYDTEREKYNKAKLEIKGYEIALESLESKIIGHEKNELAWGEKYEFQNYELKCREIKINNLNLELEKAVKERDELKDKIAKWEESAKNLEEILKSQMSATDKTSLGYSTQLNELSGNYETDSENSLSIFDGRSSDDEHIPENDRFSKNGYKAVPPPIIGNFLTPRVDKSFAGQIQDKGVIDSGCLRHMTGNMSYLIDYEELDGGYVAFGGNPKGGKITRKATKDETSGILKSFITGIENLVDHKVKVIRCDNGTEFKNRVMNQFCKKNGTKASDNAGQARKETEPVKNYILLPLWPADPPFSQDPKSSQDDGSKPSSDDEKKVDEDPRKDSESIDQEKDDNVNSTNNVNAASTNEVNAVGGKTSIELPDDPNMPALEDISIFDLSRDNEDVGAEADMNNLDTTIQVSPIPTTRIHKDHPLNQVIGDLQSATQTRNMSKNLEEHGKNPKRKRAIGTKWVFKNKKDERGIVIRNKARLVTQGYTQEEGIDYDEVFAPVARIEAIWLFLAYALFKDFVVYQMDVKSAFLYGKIEKEVYVYQPPGFEDPNFPYRVYKVEKALYGLHQAPKAWYKVKIASTPIETQKPLLKDEDREEVDVHIYRSMIGSLMYLTSSRPNIMFVVCACARYQVNPKVSHLYAVKRIFRYLKGQPKLGLWYPKDSPFDLVAYTASDYAGASLDRKSTTREKAKKSVRLIMEKLVIRENRQRVLVSKRIERVGYLLLLVEVSAVRHKLTTTGDG